MKRLSFAPHRFNRVGSMFCFFFTDRGMINVAEVMKQDLEFFKKFFRVGLGKGVFLAPTPARPASFQSPTPRRFLDGTPDVFEEVLAEI